LQAEQDKTVKIDLPAGKSDVEIGSSDKEAIYTATLIAPNGDVVLVCDKIVNNHTVPCVGHTNPLASSTKIRLNLVAKTYKDITITVWIKPGTGK
jgi:hypothetical protein